MDSLAGKTAVVTGAGSGLGAAMANMFADEGIDIVALDIDAPRAQATAEAVAAKGVRAISAGVDVADAETLRAAAELTRDQFGGCDILCANVGVQQFGALDRLTDEDWQWIMSVNVLGVVHTVNEFLPLLRERTGERHVLLTASSSFFVPGVRLGAYVTSKYAVVGYGEVLRLELAPEGIGVTIVFPAGMESRHLESSVLARPAELGESVMLPDDIEAMMASRKWDATANLATPEHAIRNLLCDLRADRPYVITHGSYRPQVEDRQLEVLDTFDRMTES
jgi:NAD(P)-dependent dehydrogenase (short-subunit alcohol dehydrogenase family)